MNRERKNQRVREELKKRNMYLWELGVLLGISESTITRLMRTELPDDEQDKLITTIRESVTKEAG